VIFRALRNSRTIKAVDENLELIKVGDPSRSPTPGIGGPGQPGT
jgi:hypothetical protein